MKKFLLSIIAVLAATIAVNAATATFDFTSPTTLNPAITPSTTVSAGVDVTASTFTSTPVTLGFAGSTGNAPKLWTATGPAYQLRVYSGNKVTIASTNDEAISKIVLAGTNLTAAYLTFDCGTYDESSKTWTGNSKEVVISVIDSTVKIKTVEITTAAAAAVIAPVITPAGGTFYEGVTAPVEVSIACETDGAAIQYSIDGGDAIPYTAPFSISKSCTVTAKATKGTDESTATSADFVITTLPSIANVNAFYGLSQNAVGAFAGTLTAVWQSGTNLIAKDDTGYMLVFGATGTTYNNGDVIPAGAAGTVSLYGGNNQLTPLEGTFKAGTAGTAVEPLVVTTATIAGIDQYMNHYVTIKNATLELVTGKNKNYTITDAAGTFAAYDQYSISMTGLTAGAAYDIVGIASDYSDTKQLNIISFTPSATGGIAAPAFSVEGGTYATAQTVAITCATAGIDAIYYTLDGTDPLTSTTKATYTAAITISKTTTLKAVAVMGDDNSVITTATYTIQSNNDCASVAAFNALSDGASAVMTCPLVVIYQNGKYLYVTDEDRTANMLVWGTLTNTYSKGDRIPAGATGTKDIFNGLSEFVPTDATFGAATAGAAVPMTIKEIGAISLSDEAAYILITNATISGVSSRNFTIGNGASTIAGYNQFNASVTLPTDLTKTYNITGFVSIRNIGYSTGTANTLAHLQIYPIEFNETSGVEDIAANAATVVAGNGEINVIGNAAAIEVYTAGGALVSKNEATVNCAAGLYIVKVDGKATKVIVK